MAENPITCIWNNDFYNTEPQPAWAFAVVFNDYIDLKTDDRYKTLNKAAQTATIKGRSLTMINYYFGGLTFRYPARTENCGEVTIKFSENSLMQVTSILQDLFSRTAQNQNWPENTGENTDDKAMIYRDTSNGKHNKIIVKILKHDDKYMYNTECEDEYVSKKITFYNCQIMNIGDVELDYSSEDALEVEATFSYDYMKVEDGNIE